MYGLVMYLLCDPLCLSVCVLCFVRQVVRSACMYGGLSSVLYVLLSLVVSLFHY